MTMTDKTVLITGASRGIGEAAATEFAAQGANVVLLARSRKDIARIADDIGPKALAIPCDVADFAQVENAVLAAVQAFGSCDVLVNNAAVLEPIGDLHDVDAKAWDKLIDINVKGVFHGVRAALHLMLAAGGGTIINISSGAAHEPYPGWSAYCASKAAVKMLTAQIGADYGAQGIRAFGLSPGTVATNMQRQIKASGVGPVADLDWEDHIPPEWVARTMVWLATSADADRLMGQDFRLREPAIMQAVGLI